MNPKHIVRRSLRPMREDINRLKEIWQLQKQFGRKNIRLYFNGPEYNR